MMMYVARASNERRAESIWRLGAKTAVGRTVRRNCVCRTVIFVALMHPRDEKGVREDAAGNVDDVDGPGGGVS
jgi:hypothetical protein